MSNSSSPVSSSKQPVPMPFPYLELQSKVLRLFIWVAVAAGLGVIISLLGRVTPLITVLAIAAYILLVSAAVAPFPYRVRAWSLLALIFIFGLIELVQAGIFGNARIFFLAFALLAALLFDRKEFIFSLVVSLMATAVLGWLVMRGILSLASREVTAGSLAAWLWQSGVMVLVAVAFEEGWRWLKKEFLVTQATLKNAMGTLSHERASLEAQIKERTQETIIRADNEKKRGDRFMAISELMQAVSIIQDPDQLMVQAARLIGDKFSIYHVGIFLNDENNTYTTLMAANSSGGERLQEQGFSLRIDQSGIVNYVAASGIPRIARRVKDDILFEANPELPETRSIMALPLQVGQRLIGVLDLESNVEGGVTEQDLDVMRMLAGAVALAIENCRVTGETQRALAEARVVYSHYMHQAWEQIATEKKTIGYRFAAAKVNALETPLDLPEVKDALESGLAVEPTPEKSAVTIPLKLRDEVIGVLDIRSNNPGRKWNENELALIQAVSDRVALALENARLFEETTRRADRERAVSEITTHIRSTTDPQVMLQTALDELKRVLGAKDVRIHPYTPPPGVPETKS